MNRFGLITRSVISMALFLILHAGSAGAFPFLKTIYTIPEDEFDFTLREEYQSLDESYRVDGFRIGFAVLSDISLWFSSSYIHRGSFEGGSGELGDSHVILKFYTGDYIQEKLHLALLADFRIPTGKDIYTSPLWRGESFGNNELTLGPAIKIDAGKLFYIHLNLFYIFTQGEGEGFYDGFSFKPSDKSSYRKLFGFNPSEEDAFFYHEKLKNDYLNLSAGINTDYLYPLIPFFSVHLYRGFNGTLPDHIPCGAGAVFLSAGTRYFFNSSSYAGIYGAVNPEIKGKLYYIIGVDMGILF